MASSSNDNCLEQLFHKLRIHGADDGDTRIRLQYIVLIQHSLAYGLRQTAVDDGQTTSVHVYRRAGLRTPSESATIDLQAGDAWLRTTTEQLAREYPAVIWVRTNPRRLPSWLTSHANVNIIDAARDPFGWESSETVMHMNDPETIVVATESKVTLLRQRSQDRVPLIIQSLTPLIQRHGMDVCLSVIERLSRLTCPVIVPVREEMLSSADHRRLEDIASAVLCLHSGTATLLRQGVRERGNLVRETIAYRVAADGQGISAETMTAAEERLLLSMEEPPESVPSSAATAPPITEHESRPGKVKLELQAEDAPRPTAAALAPAAPRIFLQDDDPEFEDYDEDDPDDDLDI